MNRPKLRFGDVLRYDFEFSNGDEKVRPAVVVSTELPSADGKGQPDCQCRSGLLSVGIAYHVNKPYQFFEIFS